MKGVIACCLKEMVVAKFGKDKWEAAAVKAGVNPSIPILATEDVKESVVMKLIESVCGVLKISVQQAADAFGEYWVCTYARDVYAPFYQNAKSAREFLLKMDDVHKRTTQTIPDARPPRFEYAWTDEKTLVLKYKSQRKLIDFLVGLVKGVGTYFKENLQVSKLNDEQVRIVFL